MCTYLYHSSVFVYDVYAKVKALQLDALGARERKRATERQRQRQSARVPARPHPGDPQGIPRLGCSWNILSTFFLKIGSRTFNFGPGPIPNV